MWLLTLNANSLPSVRIKKFFVIFSDKYSKDNELLRDLSFSIEEGEYVCLLGHNGCGKSTLARLSLGLLAADSGEIKINGLLLNEENINNGHTLKDVGKYELILTNVNGISKIYRFEVVDNYYKDNDHYVLDTDYILNPNEEIIIEYELDDIYKVKYFIINGSEYYEFEQVNNKALLKLYGSDKFNYEIKKIESIVLEEGDINLDEEISILTKKTLPNINVFSNSNQSIYEIHVSYEDKEQTFVDLCFIESNKNIKKTYLKDR